MRWNAVLVLGCAVALAGFMGMVMPQSLSPAETPEETAKAVWLSALAIGIILMCVAPLMGPKRLYKAPRGGWSRFDTGARATPKRSFGVKDRRPATFRDKPGSAERAVDTASVLQLPPPKR
jgi:hypothetical protein